MSSKDTPPSSNVASRAIQPRFGELVQGCRQLAMNHLAELLAATTSFELAGPVEMTRWPEFGPESVPLRLRVRDTQHGRERR